MKYKFILALDPSGNFNEGKGTTGWCVFNALDNKLSCAGYLQARGYACMESYWDAHITLIEKFRERYGTKNMVLVIEDYFLYKSRAENQINSKFETSKLIGVLQYYSFKHQLTYVMQPAVEVKPRWETKTLLYKGYIHHRGKGVCLPNALHSDELLNEHCLDSIRHAVHFATFKNKE